MTVRVKEFRRALGLSQQALADAVGASQQQIQRIEAGKATAKLDLALRIAEKLDTHLGLLFPDSDRVLDETADHIERGHPIPDKLIATLARAGLDGEDGYWTLDLRLRGHDEAIELPLDSLSVESLWGLLQDREEPDQSIADFAVFDGGDFRFAVNRRELVCHQLLYHVRRKKVALEDMPQDEIRLYFSGSAVPSDFDVSIDGLHEEPGETGQLAGIFQAMEGRPPVGYRFPVRDVNDEYAFFRAGAISMLIVPLSRLEDLEDEDEV